MSQSLSRRLQIVTAVLGALAAAQAPAQVNVTTYHNDISRTGANTQETILTPANVNATQFGKLFAVNVDGKVLAQPLIMTKVAIGGGTHNVAYIATEHDSLYAIDADSGAVYWQVSLLPAGGTPVSSLGDIGCGDQVPEIGVTGTPVIAAGATAGTGTLYVVAKSKVRGSFFQYLHAVDIGTGAEKFGGPVSIQASSPGSASDGNGSTVTFGALLENQRPGLLLVNGSIVIGWSSHCDTSPWHGWVMAYNATTLAQQAVFNPSENGYANGVWMSGGGPAADAAGNIYFATGNGSWNGTTDYGDSIVKLGPPSGGRFPVLDYFTPYDQANLAADDADVASGGLVLLPALPSGRQLLAQMAKQGILYVLDTNNLGKYCPNQIPACTGNDPQIVQEIPGASSGVWGSPAYWNGNLYWGPGSDFAGVAVATPDQIKAFSFNATGSGAVSTVPASASLQAFPFPAPIPSISANGTSNAILWGVDNLAWSSACSGGANCQILYAYDATNLSKMLYNSNQAANFSDVPGGANKFATPTIANGKVYVGSQSTVSAYGLLASPRPTTGVVVSLTAAANVYAIVNNGTTPPSGGLDSEGYSLSGNYTGSTVVWNGTNFSLGAAGAPNGVANASIPLPSGNFSSVNLLATAVNGAQSNQTFTITYTDGSTQSVTQSLSDWGPYSGFAGESIAVNTAYRVLPGGATGLGPWHLYGYAFAANAAKTIKSLTLPSNRNVVVLAVSLTPAGSAATPTFTLAPAASPLTLQQNAGGTDNINVAPVNGFAGAVNLAVSGLPSGVGGAFSGNELIVFPPLATPTGTYPLTITGTSGATTVTTTLLLVITAGASFSLAPAAGSVSLAPGASASDAVAVVPANGFSSAVSFTAAGFPAGATGTFTPTSSTTGTTLAIAASAGIAAGTYPIVVTATAPGTNNSAGFTVATTINLVVTASTTAGFTLTPAVRTLSLAQNAGGTDAITVTPVNGFAGAVSLAASGAPAGVGIAFSGNLLVVFPPLSTPTGTYPLTITGTSGGTVATTTVSLVITSGATFALTPASGRVSVAPGRSGTDAIGVNAANGFTASVAFAASNLPAGVTAAFSPASSASGTSLTLSVAANTKAGTYPVTITGSVAATNNSSGFASTTTLSLVVP